MLFEKANKYFCNLSQDLRDKISWFITPHEIPCVIKTYSNKTMHRDSISLNIKFSCDVLSLQELSTANM